MRVAVDVMGGDHGCGVVVAGVKLALAADPNIERVFLVGQKDQIELALVRCGCRDERIEIVHASEVLAMADKPVLGLRRKKDCSILRAVGLLKDGRAEALVSPGNTGGVVAASTIRLRPLPGVERPAIAAVVPTPKNEFVLLDAGANVECRPMHLLQYAIMGSVYSREILGYPHPRVGLLSVGTEETKGNELTQEAFKLLKQAPIVFVGNVEGHDLFTSRVEVVVCDGFVGNIVLKTCECLAMEIFGWLKRELSQNPLRMLGAALARGAFRTIKRRVDPDTYGGAPLLGLNGNVMIAHGSAGERAIMNVIRLAANATQNNINQMIVQELAATRRRLAPEPAPAADTPL
jgi:glycerol-3-phosphate acyltransferase PlsX